MTDQLDLWTSALLVKSTAGRGSNGRLEAYGIKRLRELILELAVRGKLLSQDSDDEPTSVLLKRIADERNQLAKAGKIKKPKKLPRVSDDEKPFSLPSGWDYVRLNDIGEWGAGITPPRGRSEFYGGEIPWFKSGELVGDYISRSEEFVTELALKETSLKINKPGDVLVAMYGATIGKTSILEVAATTNQAVCACTPFSGFVNTFLLTLLKAYKGRFVEQGAGGAQPNISREKIIATVIALPPTAEQHRIVAKVDELMALCDQLEQQQGRGIEAHQILVETLLGTLTNVESAQEFAGAWNRIAEHFDTLFTTEHSVDQLKQTILQLAVMGKLVMVGADWASTSLGEMGGWAVGSGFPKDEQGKVNLEVLFAKVSDMNLPENSKFITTTNHTISERTAERLRVNVHAAGTVIFPKIGGAIATNKRRILIKPTAIDNNCLGITPKEGVLTDWLYLVLSSIDLTKYQAGTSVPALSQGVLANIPVGLPSVAEQHRIVAKVDELMTLCDALKARLSEAQTTQIHLADAIVERAVAAPEPASA